MELFEKIKRQVFLWGIEDPFYLLFLMSLIEETYKGNLDIKEITKQSIKLFFEKDYIRLVKDSEIEKLNLDINDLLIKIDSEWNKKDIGLLLWMELTDIGMEEAFLYISKKHLIEKKIIQKCLSDIFISFKDVFDITKKTFQTNDLEEIKFEAIDEITELISSQIIEPGNFEKSNYIINACAPDSCDELFKLKLDTLNRYPIEGEICWFRINPTVFELFKNQKENGNLIEFWKKNKKYRQKLLYELINFRFDSETGNKLKEFTWDSKTLVILNKNNLINVLKKYIQSEIDACSIEEWANHIECRDDIGFESDMIQEIIFEFANPLIYQALTKKRANELLAILDKK